MKLTDIPAGPMRDAAERQMGKGRAPIKARRGKMNKWEQSFADEVLDRRRRAGEIRDWRFEPIKLVIGCGAVYTPDFYCRMADGSVTVFEVKGHRHAASIVRLKTAAMLWPEWKFVFVTRGKGAGWSYTPVG